MKHTLIVILSLVGLVSCDNDVTGKETIIGQQVTSVSVSCQQRKAAPGIETRAGDDMEDDVLPIIIDSFDKNSLLYFSQLGENQNPNFIDNEESASPYLYIYKYNKNEEATWDEEYNFSVQSGRQALDWETVKGVGSVGNAFSLFAFYFPVDNKVRFNVEINQSGGSETPYDQENFMKSDIMGAYHATSALYTRPRFRLFHLMVYLKVTLYVPVYQDKTEPKKENSGFNKGALQNAYVMNAYTSLDIAWRAKRSSDTEAPLTSPATGQKSNIIMYRHYSEEKIIENFNVKDYYTGGTLTTDEVRAYHFSVLFPAQSFEGNFLCFELQSPDDEKKYYYFSASQIVGDSKNYGLTQGTLQQLYLYLPRTTSEAILVGAKILPWRDAVTDMTVTQQGKNDEN